jgi:hypothetical protein
MNDWISYTWCVLVQRMPLAIGITAAAGAAERVDHLRKACCDAAVLH